LGDRLSRADEFFILIVEALEAMAANAAPFPDTVAWRGSGPERAR